MDATTASDAFLALLRKRLHNVCMEALAERDPQRRVRLQLRERILSDAIDRRERVTPYGALCTFLAGAEVTTLAGLRALFGETSRDAQEMLDCTGFRQYVPTVAELYPLSLRWLAEHAQG